MKGLILAGGRGKRINSITNDGNKCLLQAGGNSLISYNLKNLCELDEITECIVVVGHCADIIMQDLGNSCKGKKVTYCFQKEQKGLINALESAKEALKDDDFFMILGDEFILENNYRKALNAFYKIKPVCMIGSILVDDVSTIKKTYTFDFDKKNNIRFFVEKPEKPFNNYAGTGNVIFQNSVLSLLPHIPVNPIRGEKELVDLFNILIKKKLSIEFFEIGKKYFNINTVEDYLALQDCFS